MIVNTILSSWLFSKMEVVSHMLRLHLLCFTNFPILFPQSGCKVAFLAHPLLSSFNGCCCQSFLRLEDRNPVSRCLSYLFTLLVIIQPSLTHFCLFTFSLTFCLVKFLEKQTCHWSDQTEHLAFSSHTRFQSTFPSRSSVQSLEGMWCPGAWHLREGNMEYFPELLYA